MFFALSSENFLDFFIIPLKMVISNYNIVLNVSENDVLVVHKKD